MASALTAALTALALPVGAPAAVATLDVEPLAPNMMSLAKKSSAKSTVECPSSGHVLAAGNERFRQRRDLEVLWLSGDVGQPHGVRIAQHCRNREPHQDIAVVECARCGSGRCSPGHWPPRSNTPASWPELVELRLTRAGWRTAPDLRCPERLDT